MIALTAKCYFAEGRNGTKCSCKGISKQQNDLNWKQYMSVLQGCLDKAQNIGLRIHDHGVLTYSQNKLGLSAYYEKRFYLMGFTHDPCLCKQRYNSIYLY